MKKRKILNTIVLFGIIITSCCSPKIENQLLQDGFKGKVKSVKEISYKAEEKSGEIIKGIKEREHLDEYWTLYSLIRKEAWDNHDYFRQYNDKGWVTERESYYSDGNIFEKLINMFNKKGQMIESSFYNSSGNLNKKFIFNYNTKGDIIKRETVSAFGITEYTTTYNYDRKRNHIRQDILDNNGNLYGYGVFKLDENGNYIEISNYSKDNILEKKLIQKFNSRRNVIERIFYIDTLYFTFKDKYDNKNNTIEVNIFAKNDVLLSTRKFKYEYDNQDNWIKKIVILDNETKYIIEREIEYY